MMEVISLIVADWKRYTKLHHKTNILLFLGIFFHNPGMFFSLLFRIESYFTTSSFTFLRLFGLVLYPLYFIICYYVLDINIPPVTRIGKGLYIHNKGIIIDGSAVIGKDLTLIGPITIGRKKYLDTNFSARIGNNVIIYSGARVIGPVKIGNNVIIGANAVVIKSVKGNVIVGGVPAKIIKRIS